MDKLKRWELKRLARRMGRSGREGRLVEVATARGRPLARIGETNAHVDLGREVLSRVRPWVKDEAEALSWYRSFPIAELGNVTPRALVETGRGDALHRYLEHIAEGGYA